MLNLYIILKFKKILIINLAHKQIKHAESFLQSAKAQVYVLNRQNLSEFELTPFEQRGTTSHCCIQSH
jgi:hypothetical protein